MAGPYPYQQSLSIGLPLQLKWNVNPYIWSHVCFILCSENFLIKNFVIGIFWNYMLSSIFVMTTMVLTLICFQTISNENSWCQKFSITKLFSKIFCTINFLSKLFHMEKLLSTTSYKKFRNLQILLSKILYIENFLSITFYVQNVIDYFL